MAGTDAVTGTTTCVNSKEEGRWKLDRFARYLPADQKAKASASQTSNTTGSGDWKMYDCLHEPLYLILMKTSHLLITKGVKIMENYSLISARSWMRVVCKGDSILFLCKVEEDNRRFRIKFSDTNGQRGTENCNDFSKRLSAYVNIKNSVDINESRGDTQEATQEPKLTGTVELSEMANMLTQSKEVNLPLAYAKTNLPTDELGPLIRLCLADVNFPAFVHQVEQELQKITSDGPKT